MLNNTTLIFNYIKNPWQSKLIFLYNSLLNIPQIRVLLSNSYLLRLTEVETKVFFTEILLYYLKPIIK